MGGELIIKRRLRSEIGHDSTAAKRSDQAQQEQVMLLGYDALEWCRRASDAHDAHYNNL